MKRFDIPLSATPVDRLAQGHSTVRLCRWLLCVCSVMAFLGVPCARAQFELALRDGWNFVSVPIEPADDSVAAVFQQLNTGPVWGWQEGVYRVAERVEPGSAYWVFCQFGDVEGRATTLPLVVQGTAIDPVPGALITGWNAIGPGPDYMRPSHPDVLGEVFGWDPVLRQYDVVTGRTLTPGQGYWLYAEEPIEISYHTHTITGSVTGEIVAGVTMTLAGEFGEQVVLGADGLFSFPDLGFGVYDLTPSAEGFMFSPRGVHVVLDGTTPEAISFASDVYVPTFDVGFDPSVGGTVQTDDQTVAATVPSAGFPGGGGTVYGTLEPLAEPSVQVAASATVLSVTALLELPAEALSADGAVDAAYAFELAPLPDAPEDSDDRYWLGCVRLAFRDESDPGNVHSEDVYGTPEPSGDPAGSTWTVRVPTTEVARLRQQAETALGAEAFAAGQITARFESAVVDVAGHFSHLQSQAQTAGATVYERASTALTRKVEAFMLRWNPASRAFDTSDPVNLAGKRVVVLLHGWQTLAGFGSDAEHLEPHRATWQAFAEYATGAAQGGPDLSGTFEFYTVRYDSDQRVYDNALVIRQALATRFPDRHVTILAHGAGGVIAHAMAREYHPGEIAYATWPGGGISKVVTLNAPLHGTPLVQMLAPGGITPPQHALVVNTTLAFLACGTPGTVDLAWDGFDNSAQPLWENANLLALNALAPSDLSDVYLTYATVLPAEWGTVDDALAATAARIRAVFGGDYANDGVVPERSARLYSHADGNMTSRTTERGAGLGSYNHVQISKGTDTGDVNGDQYDETLYAAVLADLIPEQAGMALVPGGEFEMGDASGSGLPNELPVHTVRLSPYYVDQFEVTNRQMRDVMQWASENDKLTVDAGTVANSTGQAQELIDLGAQSAQIFFFPSQGTFNVVLGKENLPCVEVTWYGAAAYANFKSEMEGREPCYDLSDWSCDLSKNGYRLPTEAQWETAARGGATGKRFPWGDEITHQQANYYSSVEYAYDTSTTRGDHPDYGGSSAPVESFPGNGYELHELSGNVWEWCQDWYASDWYGETDAGTYDTTGPVTGSRRMVRGGSAADYANKCRSASRDFGSSPTTSHDMLGFRVVLPFRE